MYSEHLNHAIRCESIVKFILSVVCQLLLVGLFPLCLACLVSLLLAYGTGEEIIGSVFAIMFFGASVLACVVCEYVLFRTSVMHALIILSTFQHGAKQERTEQRAKRWYI